MTQQVGWRKSSYSAQEGSECVEIAPGMVRDSKNQSGPALAFDSGALSAFLVEVKAGRFDC